jgi:hypothetical protein
MPEFQEKRDEASPKPQPFDWLIKVERDKGEGRGILGREGKGGCE